jgi:hypothetical protein
MQAKKLITSVLALAVIGSAPAWSAESAIGRITYIYSDGHRIILDSQDEYDVAPSVDPSKLAVAKFVRVSLANQNGHEVVTSVSPGPAALAGDWVGKTAQS